jgi:alpha-glucosidase (family GH31 glycosyl hydrolase)
MRPSGMAHGVYLRNSNGMDVVLAANSLTYRTVGGVLDFYFFLGPQPEGVVQQYQEVIGRPHMPPYWALGFHNCRFGYPNVETLEAVVANYSSAMIPLETMWSDIDYMNEHKDFTLDPINYPKDKMNAFIERLHSNGQHYVVIVDPGIKNETGYAAYDEGLKSNSFIKDKSGDVFIGKVWPGYTAFPDFMNFDTHTYWQNQVR